MSMSCIVGPITYALSILMRWTCSGVLRLQVTAMGREAPVVMSTTQPYSS